VRLLLTKVWMAMRSKKGQSLVEYALILALVAIVVIVALTALGSHTSKAMGNVANTIAATAG
jgi:pilus assembly protein Flp/PilA